MSTDAINDLITDLSSDDYDERQKAADTLGILGEAAKAALPALRNQFIEEDDSEIRISLVKAIAKIEPDKVIAVKELLGSLGHADWEVRKASADALCSFGPIAKDALPSLWARVLTEDDDDVVDGVAEAIVAIDEDDPALVAQCIQFLQEGGSRKPQAAARVLGHLKPASSEKGKAEDALWEAIRRSDDNEFIQLALKSLVELIPDEAELLDKLLSDPKISDPKKGQLMLAGELAEGFEQIWHTKVRVMLPLLLNKLNQQELLLQPVAVEALARVSAQVPAELVPSVVSGLSESFKNHGLGFSLLLKFGGTAVANQILNDPSIPPATVGQTLLTEALETLVKRWNENKQAVLPYILASLTTRNWSVLRSALTWLRDKAGEIPRASHQDVTEALTRVQSSPVPLEFRNLAEAALIQLRQQERDVKTTPFINVIRKVSENEDEKVEAIAVLVAMGTRDALRALINEWVQWIARGEKALVEVTADLMRSQPIAVQPLVEQLLHEWQPEAKFCEQVRHELPTIEFREVLRNVYDGCRIDDAQKVLLNDWLLTVGAASEKIIDLKKAATVNKWTAEKLAKEILDILVADEMSLRARKVQLRVAKQLAEMSDPKYFEEEASQENYKKIRTELKRHAVPVLGRQLPKEENVEIRENMAQTLGYIGGRESIDALSRAVAGEERIRSARQELLAKYYLEPSKARSEEAANILKEAASEAKRTLRLQHRLNVATYIVGLVLLTTGILTSIFVANTGTRVVAALAGIGGLAGLIAQLITAPIDRIQHAMANLVQVETAFTSFIWELNLNGTYIQSQYVAQGVLSDSEIAQTVGRIEEAMNLAMNLVAVYTQDRGQRIVTRIHNLLPAAGPPGSVITIAGQHLNGDSGGKKDQGGIIAVDHKPINSDGGSWGHREVKFKLPDSRMPSGDTTIWISLFVDGIETNALPFHLVGGKVSVTQKKDENGLIAAKKITEVLTEAAKEENEIV